MTVTIKIPDGRDVYRFECFNSIEMVASIDIDARYIDSRGGAEGFKLDIWAVVNKYFDYRMDKKWPLYLWVYRGVDMPTRHLEITVPVEEMGGIL